MTKGKTITKIDPINNIEVNFALDDIGYDLMFDITNKNWLEYYAQNME